MKSIILISLLCLSLCASHLRTSTPEYDSLVLAIQWPNGVCASKSSICQEKMSRMKPNTMPLHGLWPSLKSGKMLPTCNTGAEIPVVNDGTEVFNQMEVTWPSFMKTDEEFWTHEYNKHGFCYVNENHLSGYKDYFAKTLEFFDEQQFETMMTRIFPNATGEVETTYKELKAKIDKTYPGLIYRISCKGSKGHLQLTEFYLDYDLEFKPSQVKFSQNCPTNKKFYVKFE